MGLALVVVVVAIAIAATRLAFVSAAGNTVPSPVVSSFFDVLVDSIRFAFRLVFVLELAMALLVAIVKPAKLRHAGGTCPLKSAWP